MALTRTAGRTGLALLGPAVVAGTGYIDPGNLATNLEAGARFGYQLVWVAVAAAAAAAFMQALSAKLGLATGHDLAYECRRRYSPAVARALWVLMEIAAVAADLAELLGGAAALQIMFGIPPYAGVTLTAAAAYGFVALSSRGYRPMERATAVLLVVVLVAVGYLTVRAGPAAGELAGSVRLTTDPQAVVFACAVIGATVMPHTLFVHSALAAARPRDRPVRTILRLQRIDLAIAMSVAGSINVAIMVFSAAALGRDNAGHSGAPWYHSEIVALLGAGAGWALLVAMLVPGITAAGVGALAGDVLMTGFLRWRVPRVVRRLLSLAPCLVVVWLGVDPAVALVGSQVVIGLAVPFALAVLLRATSDRRLMGGLVNRRTTVVCGSLITLSVSAINAYSLAHLG